MSDRRYLLTAACAMAGISLTDLALRLPVSRSTLYHWMRHGDPPMSDLTWAQQAARARLDDGPLTAERIAAVLGCPVGALDPESGWRPVWVAPTTGSDDLRVVLGLPPEASDAAVLDAVRELRALEAGAGMADELAVAVERLSEQVKAGADIADAVVAEARRHGALPPVAEDLRVWARQARKLV